MRPRVTADLRVHLEELDGLQYTTQAIEGKLTDLGGQGMAVVASLSIPSQRKVQISVFLDELGLQFTSTGIVCWSKLAGEDQWENGIRFQEMSPASRNALSQWLAERLGDRQFVYERRAPSDILSQRVEFQNRSVRKIVGILDQRKEAPSGAPVVIIPPPYGDTKTNALITSYYLAANNFRVLRYDATDHVGESDGDMVKCRLRTMTDDLLSAVDYAQATFQVNRIAVLANSLAARVAIKAAAEDARISMLVTLVGVMDLQSTLKQVYHEDMIGSCLKGKKWETTDVLGFPVEGAFLETAISDGYHNSASTLTDLKRIKGKVVNFATEHDLWVDPEDIRRNSQVVSAEFVLIPGGFHQLFESRSVIRSTLTMVIQKLQSHLGDPALATQVRYPSYREIGFQSRLERERSRHVSVLKKEEEKDFWEDYLFGFDFVMRSTECQRLFELSIQLAGPLEGRRILDAGCGNGNFPTWLFKHLTQMKEKRSTSRKSAGLVQYVGVDFVEQAIHHADAHLTGLQQALVRSGQRERMGWNFAVCNLNGTLPFPADYFDICICNLVISYVDDPILALRQIHHLLKAKGVFLMSSLKPFPDLSVIFREFAKHAKGQQLDQARKLLNNAGGIRYREAEGHFKFFLAEEMERLLQLVGFLNVRSWPVLANQGFLVVGEK
jgi:SAM-dependent methyltransferase